MQGYQGVATCSLPSAVCAAHHAPHVAHVIAAHERPVPIPCFIITWRPAQPNVDSAHSDGALTHYAQAMHGAAPHTCHERASPRQLLRPRTPTCARCAIQIAGAHYNGRFGAAAKANSCKHAIFKSALHLHVCIPDAVSQATHLLAHLAHKAIAMAPKPAKPLLARWGPAQKPQPRHAATSHDMQLHGAPPFTGAFGRTHVCRARHTATSKVPNVK